MAKYSGVLYWHRAVFEMWNISWRWGGMASTLGSIHWTCNPSTKILSCCFPLDYASASFSMDPCGLKHRPTERHGHEGGGMSSRLFSRPRHFSKRKHW